MNKEKSFEKKKAEHPSDRSIRAIYKASTNSAFLHDSSYYGFLEISGPIDILKSFFLRTMDPTLVSITSPRFFFLKKKKRKKIGIKLKS